METGIFPIKKPVPLHLSAGTGNYQPAVPPGLVYIHPLMRTIIRGTLLTKILTPSHILGIPFLLALRSPFESSTFAMITPSMTLSEKEA